jgi:signal transduction histidine kinase
MESDNSPDKRDTLVILAQLKEIASAVMYAAEADKLETVLERIAQVSLQLVNAQYAALGVPDGKGGLRFFKVAGLTAEQAAHLTHLPRGDGLIGAIMEERKSIRISKMQSDARSIGFCAAHPSMTSLLGVPIQIGQQLFGTFYLCDRLDNQPFDIQDEWILETLAGYAAVAIASSQLNEQQNHLALLVDRERIGMELHDGIIQSLYGIGMHLELMRLSGGASESDLGGTIANLNEVIEDIRSYIMNLHGGMQKGKTVRVSLLDILSRLYTPENLNIILEAPETSPPFTPAVFEAICQMANEAISNAIRHAKATNITIRAEQIKNEFIIVVEDDGHGFDVAKLTHDGGLGLRNLQQRAALFSGHVNVQSAQGDGTRLTITMPIRAY